MIDPASLLESLNVHASRRKSKSLNIIHQVCAEQYEKKKSDFTLRAIAQLSAQRGGPGLQAIKNKTGSDYRAIIHCWTEKNSSSVESIAKPSNWKYEDLLDQIDDLSVRAIFGSILAENTQLLASVNRLKQNSQIIIDLRGRNSEGSKNCDEVGDGHRFLDHEIEALQHAISEQTMNQEGWKEDINGRIKTANGRTIFQVGFKTAIQKVLQKVAELGAVKGVRDPTK
ncbi:MAG: hypothetical protein HY308_10645 [Gammaproteobacteria bacterium]|nr:hypothetical protein [Gammaproteobacteria bacterium]